MSLRTRRTALATLTAALTLAGVVVAACGLDAVGEKPAPTGAVDGDTAGDDAPVEVDGNVEPEDTGVDAPIVVHSCASDAGPVMVPVGDSGTCIDATEVTHAQYALFVAATGGGGDAGFLDGSVPPQCAGLTTFAPKGPDLGGANDPVTQIDWCDAYSYCIWAGKHLCTASADGGEWPRACTRHGQRLHPYGNDFDAGACNIAGDARAPVGTFLGCEGGYAGVFDMVGNAAEWVDDCSGSVCILRGGAYLDMAADCTTTVPGLAIGGHDDTTGFRCCR